MSTVVPFPRTILEETQAFLDALDGEPLRYVVFFVSAIFGGHRRRELLGFEFRDFNFTTNVVTVERVSLYDPVHGVGRPMAREWPTLCQAADRRRVPAISMTEEKSFANVTACRGTASISFGISMPRCSSPITPMCAPFLPRSVTLRHRPR